MRTTLGWIGQVVSWLVILAVACVLAVAVVIPRIGGATPYTVLTGSMQPHYPPGTLVVVKPTATDDLKIGDVATYQITSGEPDVATHRIVGVGVNVEGGRVFTFQGDANPSPDPAPVQPVQVKGKLWYAVPYLGYVNDAISGSQRQIAVWVVSAALLGYAAFMFVGAVRDRRRRRHRGDRPEPIGGAVPVRTAPAVLAPQAPILLVGGGLVGFLTLTGLIRMARSRSAT